MRILVTFTNPARDVCHIYRGKRAADVMAGNMLIEHSDAIAVGTFSDAGELLAACVRGDADASFSTLFQRDVA